MKKILISLALVLIYTFFSFSTGLSVNAMGHSISSGSLLMEDSQSDSCKNMNGTCKCFKNCLLDSSLNTNLVFLDQRLQEKEKSFKCLDFSTNYFPSKENLLCGPDLSFSTNSYSNYLSFLKFKKIIVLRS